MEFASSSSEKNTTISLAENGLTEKLRSVLLANADELNQTDWAGSELFTNYPP